MTNYQNEIMDLLKGETPKEKYEELKRLIFADKENKLIGQRNSMMLPIFENFNTAQGLYDFLETLNTKMQGITWNGKRKVCKTEMVMSSMVVEMADDKKSREYEAYYLGFNKVGTVTQD